MIKNKIAGIIILFLAGNIPLLALQQAHMQAPAHNAPATNNASTPLYLQNAFGTIANWAGNNPAALLATLGVASATTYLMYTQARRWLLPQQVSRPMQMPAQELPLRPHPQALQIPEPQIPQAPSLAPGSSFATRKQPLVFKPSERKAKEVYAAQIEFSPSFMQALQKKYQQATNDVVEKYTAGRLIFLKIFQEQHELESEEGFALVNYPMLLTKEDVRDLLWFLYIDAVATKTPDFDFFEEGTFHLHGTKEQINTLYATLMSEPSRYDRASSHYNEVLGKWDHHGIDVTGLPNNMGTVLFARMDPENLYIKPELHGTDTFVDTAKHMWSYLASGLRKLLPTTGIGGTIRTNLATFMDMRPDESKEFKKERIDPTILKRAIEYVHQSETVLLQLHIQQPPEYVEKLIGFMRNWGLKKIVKTLSDYTDREEIKKYAPQLYDEIASYVAQLKTQYPDWELRKGNEIIFSIDELLQAPQLNI